MHDEEQKRRMKKKEENLREMHQDHQVHQYKHNGSTRRRGEAGRRENI